MYDDDRPSRGSSNELILNPGESAFLQDKTTGGVQTHVGPIVVTQTGQLRPIKFSNGRFHETSLQDAVSQCVRAEKGQYLILHNPTIDENGLKHPTPKNTNASVPELRHGKKIVIPGPVQFALWPEQDAEVIDGHDLRDDQFLLVRVYDVEAAVANWDDAVVQTSADVDVDDDEAIATADAEDLDLTLGKLLIIKNVSFYIPCTGVEVVLDDQDNYVRDALTLEMSEYAILVDQSGNKRYERGPQIVFPEPTEEFFRDPQGNVKFKPIELTPTQGLHIKINCDYTDREWPDPDSPTKMTVRDFQEGDELFITGETHPIYYPREEHSIVQYGDNLIHYATAVSAGKARYVMNKNTGEHETRQGPAMILLDPTEEVFLTRVLTDAESELMYPGNHDSLEYNRSLRRVRSRNRTLSDESLESVYAAGAQDVGMTMRGATKSFAAPAALPDKIRRKTTYTKPHSVTMDDRFEGAPTLNIWTGFAVLLVKADGTRRVEVGPKVVVLDYDETMAPLHLSTGKPKTTDTLLTTGYLEVSNNKVSDIVEVESVDGVSVKVKLSYRVSFTGDPTQWFNVDNYVKFLCDHCRSRLKGEARNHTIRDFYTNTVPIVRDCILGQKPEKGSRTGLVFAENGMVVTDVEILGVVIDDHDISHLLRAQQTEVVTNQIAIDRAKQELEVTTAQQAMEREKLTAKDETRKLRHQLNMEELSSDAEADAFQAEEAAKRKTEAATLEELKQRVLEIAHEGEHNRQREVSSLRLEEAKAETENLVARFQAAGGDFAAAIRELGDKKVLEVVAEAMGPMRIIGGGTLTDALSSVLSASKDGSVDNGVLRRLGKLAASQQDYE